MELSKEAKLKTEIKETFKEPAFGDVSLKEIKTGYEAGLSDMVIYVEIKDKKYWGYSPTGFRFPEFLKEEYEVRTVGISKFERRFFGDNSIIIKIRLDER